MTMASSGGYAGSILWVDLSTGRARTSPTAEYTELYLGGRGLAAKIYWDEVPPDASAFDPENRLIFVTGPVTATTGFAGSRWQICGKSSLHDQFSYCNLGGAWGAKLKRAGYDALVVHGQADAPVYLSVTDDGVEIRDAAEFAGTGAITCREALQGQLGKSTGVVAIGPAGENRVTFSTLLADSDSSGSSVAAVMGAKNLKAVAVSGSGKIDVSEPERIREIRGRVRDMRGDPDPERSAAADLTKLKKQVCHGCTGGCPRREYTGQSGKRGKYMCDSSWFYSIRAQRYYGETNEVPFEANKLCDDYGLDSYGVETMIMWLIRCYKEKILTEEQTGLPLSKIGSLEFIEALIDKVSRREGFGDLLANGTREAAKSLGKDAEALITDYLTRTGYLSVYGGRMYLTTGLFDAMEPRLSIHHLHAISVPIMRWAAQIQGTLDTGITSDVIRGIGKRFWGGEIAADFSTYEGKARAAAIIQDREYAEESLILCDFVWPIFYSAAADDGVGDPALESQLCSAVTGREVGEDGLYRIGERVFNLQRAVLAREGRRGREDDALEEFNFTAPLKSDFNNPDCLAPGKDGEVISRKGMVVDRQEFEKMKDEYYEIRGWDVATGRQKKDQLERLDLGHVAQDLDSRGLLA
jgi:aldehyde:ferredoxin oxidoreductase